MVIKVIFEWRLEEKVSEYFFIFALFLKEKKNVYIYLYEYGFVHVSLVPEDARRGVWIP